MVALTHTTPLLIVAQYRSVFSLYLTKFCHGTRGPASRMGYFDNKKVAHDIVPKVKDWGLAGLTLHGRSRQQRYSRLAGAYTRPLFSST